MSLAPLIVPAVGKHTATVIMAHGLGDSGAGWVSLAQNWRRRGKFDEVKFIFPNAPNIPISVNGGVSMPGWYDITTFTDLRETEDEPGILRSRNAFNTLIAQEVSETSIPASRIILGGFSQGGSMSIFTGLTTTHKLGGVFALSAYLLLGGKVAQLANENGNKNADTKWFVGHGDADPLVKYAWGKASVEMLTKDLGVKDLNFKTYHGLAHSADPTEIDDLEAFLRTCLPSV